jgi:hypothetical protein
MFDLIRREGRGREFDCLIGISGGLDSSYLTITAKNMGLRPLLCHFDNGFNAPVADDNIKNLVDTTGFAFVRFAPDLVAYRKLCAALIATGLPDADIANDIGMAKFSLDVAKQYGIKWILNGHNYQYEGWNPLGWTYMDGRYLADICRKIAGFELPPYMRLGLVEQFSSGVKHARPYYQFQGLLKEEMVRSCVNEFGWKSYGSKHCENIYTEWVGSVYLPMMGIDKRRNYLSADIRCGRITKEQAKQILTVQPSFEPEKMAVLVDAFGNDVFRGISIGGFNLNRGRFASYKTMLRRYWPLVWMACKMDLVPEAFYRKYAKG